MLYHYKQLQNGRWGIFINNKLVASIGCFDTCKTIMQFLENRLSHQDIPSLRENFVVTSYFQDLKLRP